MNNQPFMVRPTPIDLNHDKLDYYPFIMSMNRCNESCSLFQDPVGKIWILIKMEDVDLKVFNMIKGVNESKTLAKHISCERRCTFDGRKCNSGQKENNDKCQCECKKPITHPASKNTLSRILVHVVASVIRTVALANI